MPRRVLWVVQRYGPDVLGGAEAESRDVASRLAARGHQVTVLTSCAVDYVTWADHDPPGTTHDQGVTVHRLPVAQERQPEFFTLDGRMRRGDRLRPAELQRWLLAQGPVLPELPGWIRTYAPEVDVAIFMTYLYWPTVVGLPLAAPMMPTVLVPTAHDEPALHQPLYDTLFHQADRLYYNSHEEADLLARRLGCRRPGDVIGTGIDLGPPLDPDGFRRASGLADEPYLVYVGRIDEHKGALTLVRWFAALKERHPGPLRLVLVGRSTIDVPPHPDVVVTGFVSEAVRNAAMAGALALVQPSPNESFSLVLAEAWACGTPAIVSDRSPVLVGQAHRSGGALPVGGFAEFEAAVELLQQEPSLRAALAAAGRRYVEQTYAWDVVVDRVEGCLETAIDQHRHVRGRLG